ncbi:MAG TPA: hypothetical protein VEA60_06200 [Allosphingosinicella sp.]|nr:hypothetical protein [Allosphingosinicella sp.]
MKIAVRAGLCLAIAAVSVGSVAIAAGPATVVTEDARTVQGGRAVQVLVAQSEIRSNINPSNIAVATGGGLLGGALAASQNASRTKKAEALIEPVREALTDLDVDRLAQDTTAAALAQVPWLQSAPISFSKDSSPVGKSAALDSLGTSQVVFIEYSYDFSPDFADLRVVAKVDFANKAMPAAATKPEARVNRKNLAYSQQVTTIVSLSTAVDEKAGNAAQWSADGGKRAREALALAFAQQAKLLPRALALTAGEVAAMAAKTRPKGNVAGFAGRVQDSPTGETMLWGPGFIWHTTLP